MGSVIRFAGLRSKIKTGIALVTAMLLGLGTVSPAFAVAGAAPDTSTSGYYGSPATQIDVLANDTPSDASEWDLTSLKLCGDGQALDTCVETSITLDQGVFDTTTNPGKITFTPAQNYYGEVAPVTYAVADTSVAYFSSTVTVTITAPTAGTAVSDSLALVKNAPSASVAVLENDTAGGEAIDNTSVAICETSVVSAASCVESAVELVGKGSFSVSSSSVSFTAATDYVGAAAVQYVFKDTAGQYSNLTTVTFTTVGSPSATADTSSDLVNVEQTISPLNNDSVAANSVSVELDSATLALCGDSETSPNCTATSVEVATKGTFAISSTSVTFTPVTDFVGTATVDYQVADDLGQVASATITVTVTAATADASATDDTNTAAYDVTQDSIDVVANDTATDGESFTNSSIKLCLGSEAMHVRCTQTTLTVTDVGTYTANDDGTISFNPVASFAGSNSVEYEITDTSAVTVRGTLTVTVEDPTPGSAVADTALMAVNGSLATFVLTNDTAGGASLATEVKLCETSDATSGCTLETLTVPGDGSYTVNFDGSISFAPEADLSGELTAIAYEAFDITGQSAGTATLTLTVIPEPTAVDDTSSADQGVTQTYLPLENDLVSDLATVNSVDFVVASLKLCGIGAGLQTAPSCDKTSLSPAAGSVTLAAGEVTFDPTDSFSGDLVVYYQVADELSQVVSASITFTSVAAAEAADDSSTGDYNQPQILNILSNDTASTGATFDEASLLICQFVESPDACSDTELDTTDVGVFAINENAGVTFTPSNKFVGTTQLYYEITDSSSNTATGNLTFTVGAPDSPVLTADSSEGDYDENQVIDVLANDTGTAAELDPTRVLLCRTSSIETCLLVTRFVPSVGYFTVDAETGEITFNPSSKFWGETEIYYTVLDVTSQYADPVAVTITVNEAAAETINKDFSAGAAENVQTIDVLFNDNAGESSFVSTSIKLCDDDQLVAADCDLTSYTTTEGVYAVVSGKVTFTPVASFEGEATKPARYTASVTDLTRFGIAEIQVAVISAATPTADEKSTTYDQDVSVDVSTNDVLEALAYKYEVGFDPATIRLCQTIDGDVDCSFKKVIVPGIGIFTVDTLAGSVLFNPSPTFAGDSVTVGYQIADTIGNTSASTVEVSVSSAIPATLIDDTSFAKQGAKQTLRVLDNDSRGEAYLNPATVRLCDSDEGTDTDCTLTTLVVADEGTYRSFSDGRIEFTPLTAASGVMTAVSYQVKDVTGQVMESADITVSVINKPNTSNDTSSIGYDVTFAKNVLSNDQLPAVATANSVTLNVRSVRLCAKLETAPSCTATELVVKNQGTYSVNTTTGIVTFNPLNTFAGAASAVTYIVKDSLGQTSSATYTVTVANPAAATIVANTGWAKQGATQKFRLSSNDVAGGAPLVAKSVRLCGNTDAAASCATTKLVVAGEGTYTVSTRTGQVTFVPLANFFGVATPVYYSVADITGYRSAKASLTVTVVGKPIPVADTAYNYYKQVVSFTPTSNDGLSALATSKGVTLDLASLRLCAKGQTAGKCDATKVVVSGEGTYRLNRTTRVVSFTPLETFAGRATPLNYQIKDSLGLAQTATLTATVAFPDPSLLVDDTALAAVAITKPIKVLENDLSIGAAIKKTTVKLCSAVSLFASDCNLNSLTIAGEGTYTVDQASGVITFKSVADFSGEATAVAYSVADITGQRASMAAISVTVVDGPVLLDDESTDDYDTNQAVAVLENDTISDLEEANSIEINAATLRLCAVGKSAPSCNLSTLSVSGKGVFSVDLTSSEIRFNPAATFSGDATVKYQVKDELGNAADASVTFTVNAPAIGALSDDSQNVLQGQKATVNVLANDTRGDAPYKVATVRLCAAGELTGAACSLLNLVVAGQGTYRVDTLTGKITFTPELAYTGAATAVRYTVADITGQKAVPAEISITVNAVP